jgi:hypothetical protein
MLFLGPKCTKAHLRESLVQKKLFRLANARHKGEGKGTEGRGGGGEGRPGPAWPSTSVGRPVLYCILISLSLNSISNSLHVIAVNLQRSFQ